MSLIEVAITLPLILLLITGLLEYGWLFLKSNHLANAVRQGARFAAPPDATRSDAETLIQQVMNEGDMDSTMYTITWNPATEVSAGQTFTCTVTLNYAAVSLGMPLVPTPATLSSSITMMKEGP